MAKLAGIELQDWQQDVIDDWSAVYEDGQFVHRRNGGSIPRQAGKSVDGIAWAVYLLVAMGATVLWTDHNYSTTVEMLRRFREIFGKEANDKFAKHKSFNKLVSYCNNKTAQEAIFLKNGGSLHFSTRTKSANLGYSFDVVFYDEAQELTDEQQQAIMPTTTSGALGNPQAIYLGTPPRAGGSGGEIFTNLRADAITGGDQASDLSWWEWGVSEIGDVHDESRWYGVNPSLGRVANINAIRAGSRSMSAIAFAQEYLGYWLPKSSAKSVIDEKKWSDCVTDSPPESGLLCYGVKFSPDGQVGTLSACIKPKNGPAYIEVIENRPMSYGLTWFVDWLVARKSTAAQVTIDGMSNAQPLVDELQKNGMSRMVVRPKAADMASACSMLLNAVNERKVTHFNQPALNESALLSQKRTIGSGGGWGFADNNCDSTLIESCALAYWGAITTKRNPERKQRMMF